jgi:hypothetical protein
MGDAWGVSNPCSLDVFNVGKIKKSIYCDALFISPLLDGSCSEMLALDNNLENEKSFDESLIGNSKRSCWLSSSFNNKGSSFDVPPLLAFKRTSNI